MIKFSDAQKIAEDATESIAITLGIPRSAIDYEFQDGGKFLLFTVVDAQNVISSESMRALIYRNIKVLLRGLSVKWMLVSIDEKGEVVDEIDSMIGC